MQPVEDQRGDSFLVRLQRGGGDHDIGRAEHGDGGRDGFVEQTGEVERADPDRLVAHEGGDAPGEPVAVVDPQVAGRPQHLGQLERARAEPLCHQPVGARPGQLGLLGEQVEHPGHPAAQVGRQPAMRR